MHAEYSDSPFRHWVLDDFAPHELLWGLDPDPEGVPWVLYDNDCEKKKRTCNDPAKLGWGWGKLFGWLNSDGVVEKLADLTGVKNLQGDDGLYGAGLHLTDPGGWLNCHLDYALHQSGLERRVNLILFLNAWWKEEWGGALEFWDDAGRGCVKRVYPLFNRAVAWEAGDTAYHACQRTQNTSSVRITAACYYLAPARPGCVRKRALYTPNRGHKV